MLVHMVCSFEICNYPFVECKQFRSSSNCAYLLTECPCGLQFCTPAQIHVLHNKQVNNVMHVWGSIKPCGNKNMLIHEPSDKQLLPQWSCKQARMTM